MQNRTGEKIGLRSTVAMGSKLIFFGLALGIITLTVSPLAAALAGSFVLWFALVKTVRTLHREENAAAERVVQMHAKYNTIIAAMLSAVGLRDDISAGHGRRVSDLASILAQQLQVSHEDVLLIQEAAILADVGKMEIAQSILSKEGELSEDEWDEMRRHPELGAQILSDVPQLKDAAEIVLAHHERFDGQGYPAGLNGEEIPIGARIYSVADAYVAMTSDRPYRKKMPHDMALHEVLRNSLTQFDPEVVRAFVRAEEMDLFGKRAGPASTNGAEPSITEVIAKAS